MEYEKESRKSTGVAFVLAVYAASRLFYPMARGTHTLGGSRKSPPYTVRTYDALKIRFSTKVGEEPEVEVALR